MTNEMTAKEAVKQINENCYFASISEKTKQALDMAIKALKLQPCEDCISRQAVLDVINFEDEWLFDAKSHNADTKIAFSAIKSKISELPSVTPRRDLAETSQDCISREEMLKYQQYLHGKMSNEENHKLWNFIKGLPSVTPERPKGKWIEVDVRNFYATLKCSVCDRVIEPYFTFGEYSYEDIKKFYPYCHCGAEMSGGGEDEEEA